MADGKIKIDIEVDGKQVDTASKSFDKLGASGEEAGKGVKDTEEGVKGAGNESEKAGGKVKKFATALGLVAIGTAAFHALKGSMDDAIKRFDTLNNFPKVLQALGVSAEDSERAMSSLSDGIDGLPTKLDEISSVAQRMYTSFGDMDKATDSALALNNALLGSGASAADAQRGTEQYLQALQTGKMDMMQWRTLQETMDVALIKVAESFGYAGQSAKDDLYKALQDGTITMDQFNDKMIEVGTGTGIMAKLAKENSLGIETSLGNLRNAAARGIASILDSFNKLSKEVTGKDIAQNIDSLKGIVTSSFNVIGDVIESTTPLFKLFGSVVGGLIPIIKPLTPVLVGIGTAIASLMIVRTAGNLMKSFGAAVAGVTVIQKAATVATTASAVAYNTFTGRVVAARVAQTAFTTASAGLRSAMLAITGPVGWATIGIGALAGATVGIVKWFNRSSEEGERLKAEVEKMGEATDSLTESVDGNTDAYREQIRDI
uniref:tape measure protein n=1 Tax=Microbulbifer pacificus TaxID=407164 RepID=UPI001319ED10